LKIKTFKARLCLCKQGNTTTCSPIYSRTDSYIARQKGEEVKDLRVGYRKAIAAWGMLKDNAVESPEAIEYRHYTISYEQFSEAMELLREGLGEIDEVEILLQS
jgi:CHAD domain-containing protein